MFAKAICRAYVMLEVRSNGKMYVQFMREFHVLAGARRRSNLVLCARTVRWISGNSTAREASCKCDTNWNDVTYVRGTCLGETRCERADLFIPPWLGSNARFILALGARSRFFKFILANDCSRSSSFIAISCVRSIKIPRYARIVTCVTPSIVLFSRRIVAIPSAYNPLAARDWRPPPQWVRSERSGRLCLQATNAKFRDETKFWGEKNDTNFTHTYMQ